MFYSIENSSTTGIIIGAIPILYGAVAFSKRHRWVVN